MPEPTADPLDAQLRAVATALVAEAPAPPPFPAHGLGARTGGAGTAPRGPWLAVLATAAAAAALVAGVVAVLTSPWDDAADKAQTDPEPPVPPADRLVYGQYEWLADGSIRDWAERVDGLVLTGWLQPLPDGGLVASASVDPPSPTPHDTGPAATDLRLLVMDADGTVVVERQAPPLSPMAATSTEVYFTRRPAEDGVATGPAAIVAQELYSGAERTVQADGSFDPERVWGGASGVTGDSLVTVEASTREVRVDENSSYLPAGSTVCQITVTDIATGRQTVRPAPVACAEIRGVRLSEDGSSVAVAYNKVFDDPGSRDSLQDIRVAVIDVATGTVALDHLLGHNVSCGEGSYCPPGADPVSFLALSWDGPSALRVLTTEVEATAYSSEEELARATLLGTMFGRRLMDPSEFTVSRVPIP